MSKYKVYWHYAMKHEADGRLILDPRRAGGEYEYEANSPDEAIEKLAVSLERDKDLHPFDRTLIDASAYEMTGDLIRGVVISALRTLSAEQLETLIAEVKAELP